MLLTQRTEVFLIQKWRKGEAINAQEYLHGYMLAGLITGLITCFGFIFNSPFALNVTFLVASCLCLLVAGVAALILKSFEVDSTELYQKLNPLFSQCQFKDFEKLAFDTLAGWAEHCLWQQTHNPHDHGSIRERQIEFKNLYDLCGRFQLLHESCAENGYKIYFDEAKKNSEVPEWFLKYDPSVKKEAAV